MTSAKGLARQFIGAAKNNPEQAPAIFRRAAEAFIGLARDPKNARSSRKLQDIALDFAGAASAPSFRPPVMDDFADLLHETEIAYNEVGDDPMDLVARRREVHDDRTKITPGAISIAPESFNKDATLGRSAVIKFAPTNDEIKIGILQEQNVAFWQGVKKEAQAMTVDVGFVNPPPPPVDNESATPLSIRPYGIVEFGSDGNRTTVKFDLGRGTRLTVVGNYVSLRVGMDPPQRDIAGVSMPTTAVTVGASIGTFAAPSQSPVISTVYVDQLAPGSSDFFPIPFKAVELLPVQFGLLLGDSLAIDFFGFGGGTSPQYRFFSAFTATNQMLPIPIPGDIYFFKVANGMVGTRNYRFPFQLSL